MSAKKSFDPRKTWKERARMTTYLGNVRQWSFEYRGEVICAVRAGYAPYAYYFSISNK